MASPLLHVTGKPFKGYTINALLITVFLPLHYNHMHRSENYKVASCEGETIYSSNEQIPLNSTAKNYTKCFSCYSQIWEIFNWSLDVNITNDTGMKFQEQGLKLESKTSTRNKSFCFFYLLILKVKAAIILVYNLYTLGDFLATFRKM